MNMRVRFFSILICGLTLFSAQTFAQSVRQGNSHAAGPGTTGQSAAE